MRWLCNKPGTEGGSNVYASCPARGLLVKNTNKGGKGGKRNNGENYSLNCNIELPVCHGHFVTITVQHAIIVTLYPVAAY
jgi:hypothetical protein